MIRQTKREQEVFKGVLSITVEQRKENCQRKRGCEIVGRHNRILESNIVA